MTYSFNRKIFSALLLVLFFIAPVQKTSACERSSTQPPSYSEDSLPGFWKNRVTPLIQDVPSILDALKTTTAANLEERVKALSPLVILSDATHQLANLPQDNKSESAAQHLHRGLFALHFYRHITGEPPYDTKAFFQALCRLKGGKPLEDKIAAKKDNFPSLPGLNGSRKKKLAELYNDPQLLKQEKFLETFFCTEEKAQMNISFLMFRIAFLKKFNMQKLTAKFSVLHPDLMKEKEDLLKYGIYFKYLYAQEFLIAKIRAQAESGITKNAQDAYHFLANEAYFPTYILYASFFTQERYIATHSKEIEKYSTLALGGRNKKDALYNLGFLAAYAGEKEKAKRFYKEAWDLGNPSAAHNLGQLLQDEGDIENAKKYFLHAAKNDVSEGYSNMGRILMNEKKFKEAEEYFKKALAAGSPFSHHDLGNLYHLLTHLKKKESNITEENDDFKKAETYYNTSIAKGEKLALLDLGLLYQLANLPDKAERVYQDALKAHPGSFLCRKHLSQVHYIKNNLSESKKQLKLALQCSDVRQFPESIPKIHYLLGKIMAEMGGVIHKYAKGNTEQLRKAAKKYLKAEAYFKESLKGGHRAAHLDLAVFYTPMEDDTAEEHYKKAIQFNISGAEAYYANYLEGHGRHEEAAQYRSYAENTDEPNNSDDGNSEEEEDAGNEKKVEAKKNIPARDLPCAASPSKPRKIQKGRKRRTTSTSPKSSPESTRVTFTPPKKESYQPPAPSKRHKKMLARAGKQRNRDLEKSMISKRDAPALKTYLNVNVSVLHDARKEVLGLHQLKIQGFITSLANGESRAKLEMLARQDEKIFSMRLTKQDRFVFRIIEGNLQTGVLALEILEAGHHYAHTESRAASTTKATPLQWSN